MTHAYKAGLGGRSIHIDKATRQKNAHLICSMPGCGKIGEVHLRTVLPVDVLDKKFHQQGWELDPHICPECVEAKRLARRKVKVALTAGTMMDDFWSSGLPIVRDVPASAKPEVKELEDMNATTTIDRSLQEQLKPVSAPAHKATAKMHRLLDSHFSSDEGRYEEGWDDERIAFECGLAAQYVGEVRDIAYGELKESPELVALRNDIKALRDLITEQQEQLVTAQREVNQLVTRIDAFAKTKTRK